METTFFESKDEGGRFIDCPFFIWDNDGFHIIFATIWVGLPLMILVAELHYHYVVMEKRWTKSFAVLLGVGIPTGTIAGVHLFL